MCGDTNHAKDHDRGLSQDDGLTILFTHCHNSLILFFKNNKVCFLRCSLNIKVGLKVDEF